MLSKKLYIAIFFFFFITGVAFCINVEACDFRNTSGLSGTLSVSSSTVKTGENFYVYISGRDSEGLDEACLEENGSYTCKPLSGTFSKQTWQISKSQPGTYTFCGGVSGDVFISCWEEEIMPVETNPQCISVNVISRCQNDCCQPSCPSPTPTPCLSCGSNECPANGETRCSDNWNRQTCGNFDSDSFLEWSSPQSCSGDTSCGYGNCSDSQKPSWICSGGSCTYNCNYDSSCAPACECTSGPCCDGCHYKSSSSSCNSEVQSEYGCPWGSSCGADVGKRTKTRLQYCSGYSSQCSGVWGDWSVLADWTIADACSATETCSTGISQCQYNSGCVQQPSYFRHYSKNCYQSVLYWLDSNGLRQDIYSNCSDNNDCTIDACQGRQCVNELKCDGSTCAKDSENYCKSCNTCGDDVCNCGETFDSCSQDCKPEILVVAVLGKKGSDPIKWVKDIDMKANEPIDFLVVVKNKGDKTLNDVNVKVEIPQEITYQGDLRLEGSTIPGDIRDGVDIDSLDANGVKSLTFKGKIQSGEVGDINDEVIGLATAGNLSDTHTLLVNIKQSSNTAGVGVASIGLIFQRWYFWVFAFLVLLLLFYTVFRRLFLAA